MVKFDIPLEKFSFKILPENSLTLSEEQKTEIEARWEQEKLKNPSVFRGMNFGLNKFSLNEDKIEIALSKLEYPILLWGRTAKVPVAGTFTLSAGVYLRDAEYYYFATRKNVSFNKGKIGIAMGGVDFDGAITEQNFGKYIQQIAHKEAHEEFILKNTFAVEDLEFLGAAYSLEERKLAFRFITNATVLECTNDENSDLIKVPVNNLGTFYKENIERINPIDHEFIPKLIQRAG